MSKRRTVFISVIFLLTLASILSAQAAEADIAARRDSLESELRQGELILQEILIEGVVEKPNVTILPSRKQMEFSEIDFINRSFAAELQTLPARSHLFGGRMRAPIRHSRLKAILEQDKEDFIRQ